MSFSHALLNRISSVCFEKLKDSSRESQELVRRGLVKEEIEALKIGFADKSFFQIIPSELKAELKEAGVSKEDLSDCFVFPIANSDKAVEDILLARLKGPGFSDMKLLNNSASFSEKTTFTELMTYLKSKRIKTVQDIQKDGLSFLIGKRTWLVRGMNPTIPNRMKVNIKAVMGAKSHVDTVDLYSAKLRSGLVNQCCILFEEDREVILDEVGQLVNKLEEVRTEYRAKHGQPEAPEIHISKEDRKQALKILESEDLLKMIGEDLEKTGIAGEEINRRMMYMVFTSRKLANPISVTVKGDSSGGKSYLINQTLKLFPEEDVKNFTEISAKSLFYMPEDALEHKILVIFERHGSESSDYSIRSLQSENKLKIAVACRDPLTNEIKTTERIVRGPVCFVETTTALNIHAENETRCFDLYVDESEKQTEKIFFNQNLSYQPSNRLKPEEQEGILRKHKTIQRLLKPVRVVIDYVDKIKFPKHELRFRRDRVKFLSLIECFAFIYQYQRVRVIINGEEYVKATLEDYRMAYELAAKIMTDTLSPLHQKSRELLDHIVAFLTAKSKTSFSVGDIAEKTGWKSLRIRRYLKQLEEEEYVERKNPGPGVRALFILCRSGPRQDILSGLLSPQDLKRLVS